MAFLETNALNVSTFTGGIAKNKILAETQGIKLYSFIAVLVNTPLLEEGPVLVAKEKRSLMLKLGKDSKDPSQVLRFHAKLSKDTL